MQTYAYGFPRLGKNREFKKVIESFWANKITDKELVVLLKKVEEERLAFYKEYIDTFPLGEFTYYDNIFDTALIFGAYRFKNFKDYFEYARGENSLELKKYFNTNYHYIVPSLKKNIKFSLSWNKPIFYFDSFSSLKDKPLFLVGPYTFLKLSRSQGNFDKLFSELCCAYQELFEDLKDRGLRSLHIEEPAFCLDTPQKNIALIVKNYKKIIPDNLKVNLITYYESVDFLKELYDIPFHALGLDFIAGQYNLEILKKNGYPRDKKIICGIVDGRGVHRSNISEKVKLLKTIQKACGIKEENILVSNSTPLYHLPVTLENETRIPREIKTKMSFAKERLAELRFIKDYFDGRRTCAEAWSKNVNNQPHRETKKIFDTLTLSSAQFIRRKKLHKQILNLPLFPVTTIGSFPQDSGLRKQRFSWKEGRLSLGEYTSFVCGRILELIELQEDIGLDVLVHGEFERSDMVEYFAHRLNGFLATDNGWVISYGTRAYRPPIIYEKIQRRDSLGFKEIFYAQSLTPKPVKGILTGPVTMLSWSYNLRNDPLYSAAFELARALNSEVKQLKENGIKIIQIDEPAIKELAPLKKRNKDFYFSWAVRAFNLAVRVHEAVQIHTHMCYSDFGEIVKWIMKMNFDVISLEAARENAKIVGAFKKIKFDRSIGPGVWDIHSKVPAKEQTIKKILDKSIKTFKAENIWVNPDCGLKTRQWPEVNLSLKRIVNIAKLYRNKFKKQKK